MEQKPNIGKILTAEENSRDAIHCAIIPVIAAHKMSPAAHIGINSKGEASYSHDGECLGIADPFLESAIHKGQKFYLFLYPGTITSLKHFWTHPAFNDQIETCVSVTSAAAENKKSESEKWMRAWAIRHMGEDYYNDDGMRSEDVAYESAINAGHDLSVGPYESAADYINDEWWGHWEAITGQRGQRGEYFSCGC